jgi:hypothetical protein
VSLDEDFSEYGFESLRPAIDEFGVPSNILGPHPEEFFSLLGRIVALAAALESNVRAFCECLGGLSQGALANASVKRVIAHGRKNFERLAAPDARTAAQDFLSRAEASILKRHIYVHSLWPAQGGGRLFGWKQPRRKNATGTDTISTTLTEMREDVLRFVELCEVPYWHRILSLVSGGYHLLEDAGDA